MTRSRRRLFAAGLVVIALAGVGLGAHLITDGRAKEGRRAAKGPAPAAVSVARVVQQTVPVRLNAIGNVEPYASVALKARVDGQIVAVNFREGEAVRKGEILFRIDPRPYEAALRQAQANALRDAAARDQARSQEKRYQDLLEKNFVSKEAYAQIRTNAATAEATAKASEAALETARLNLEYCRISSPLDGYVGKILLQAGNLVKANDTNPLVVINQVKPIYVTFAVPEQDLARIRRYMASGPLEVAVASADITASRPSGRLVFVDNAVDAATGTIRLRAQFDNADTALWPGQFVNVSVKLHEQADALVVPSIAVQTGPQGEFVYVLGQDSKIQMRPVKVARTENDVTVVASGLRAGESVVTHGQLGIAPGVRAVVRSPAS